MITNLFSIFDPASVFFQDINHLKFLNNWVSLTFLFFLIPQSFYLVQHRENILLKKRLNFITLIMSENVEKKKNLNLVVLTSTLFTFLAFLNFSRLFPYVFSASTHLAFTLNLALPIWAAYTLYFFFEKTTKKFAHLVPHRTPLELTPFIVLIESVRIVVRPFALAVRLTANIIAGHLLITLLCRFPSIWNPSSMLFFIPGRVILFSLEIAVALIQAYVFVTLTTLYVNEL